jgi:hypothetical protein
LAKNSGIVVAVAMNVDANRLENEFDKNFCYFHDNYLRHPKNEREQLDYSNFYSFSGV